MGLRLVPQHTPISATEKPSFTMASQPQTAVVEVMSLGVCVVTFTSPSAFSSGRHPVVNITIDASIMAAKAFFNVFMII